MTRTQFRDCFQIVGFSKELLVDFFGTSRQANYLRGYLDDLKATAVIREFDYVDRHFLEDYVGFYSKTFQPPTAHCERWHFFADIDAIQLKESIVESHENEVSLRAGLQNLKYLGFVVRRPLDSTPIGRTVLMPYADRQEHRAIPTTKDYTVHLCGLTLKVPGLAFQQQDGGAAVCASTALWCALQKVSADCGLRSPTPMDITRAAGSPYPASHGLTDDQMASAITRLGYSVDMVPLPKGTPQDDIGRFLAQVVAFLDSGLPVILLLDGPVVDGRVRNSGHAVTVSGYRKEDQYEECRFDGRIVRTPSANVFYVHDDNLGFHCHYEVTTKNVDEHALSEVNSLCLIRGDSSRPADETVPDLWVICGAMIPKPDKIRLPVEQLFSKVVELDSKIEAITTKLRLERDEEHAFRYRFHYSNGISVEKSLTRQAFSGFSTEHPFLKVSLPRHLGVVEVFWGDRPYATLIYDATSLSHHQKRPLLILASEIEPAIPAWKILKAIAEPLDCLLISRGTGLSSPGESRLRP